MSPAFDSKIAFTRAEIHDADKLIEWIERYYAYDHIEFNREKILASLPDLLKTDDYGSAYFIERDQKQIGYFILTHAFDIEFGGRHAILTDFFFLETERRSGLGTVAFAFIESICLSKNFSHIELQVEIDNEEAKAFYRKLNFTFLTRHILIKDLGAKRS